jgi:uncharacterized protein YbaR (Trm112 family)
MRAVQRRALVRTSVCTEGAREDRPAILRFRPRAAARRATGLIVDTRLLDILVCPICKGPLVYRKAEQELVCKADRLAFPIRDDIPVMLEDEARKLDPEEEVG